MHTALITRGCDNVSIANELTITEITVVSHEGLGDLDVTHVIESTGTVGHRRMVGHVRRIWTITIIIVIITIVVCIAIIGSMNVVGAGGGCRTDRTLQIVNVVNAAGIVQTATCHHVTGWCKGTGHDPIAGQWYRMDLVRGLGVPHEHTTVLTRRHQVRIVGTPVDTVDFGGVTLEDGLAFQVVEIQGLTTGKVLHCMGGWMIMVMVIVMW